MWEQMLGATGGCFHGTHRALEGLIGKKEHAGILRSENGP
jgi:hypothetical protein